MSAETPASHGRNVMTTSLVAVVVWGVLVAGQLGFPPLFRYAWAFNLWAYFPVWVGGTLAAVALLLCLPAARRALLDAWPRGRSEAGVRTGPLLLGLGAGAAVLWLLRERYTVGDSKLLVMQAISGWHFVFQEPGASFLISKVVQAGKQLGIPGMPMLAAWSAFCFVPTAFFLHRASRALVPAPHAGWVTALLLSGGVLRVFAGHVEVYAPVLAAASGYLWAASAHLTGRARWWVPALALGVAVWMHLSALMLVPSLVALPWLGSASAPGPRGLRRLVADGLIALLPFAAFIGGLALFGQDDDLGRALERALQILGVGEAGETKRWWVRGFTSYPSIGTDVVFLSPPHLKYLANAFYLLCPAAIPLLAGLVITRGRVAIDDDAARFLAIAALPLFAYSCLLRPFWGPYDWDLFALTVLVSGLLAGRLLATQLDETTRAHVLVCAIGFHLCFVTIPFIANGAAPIRNAGPFGPAPQEMIKLLDPKTEPPPEIAPWL